jgi:hypothetical protein
MVPINKEELLDRGLSCLEIVGGLLGNLESLESLGCS